MNVMRKTHTFESAKSRQAIMDALAEYEKNSITSSNEIVVRTKGSKVKVVKTGKYGKGGQADFYGEITQIAENGWRPTCIFLPER